MGAVFRVLGENGWTQRAIGAAVGMHQSEVSEIRKGRRVIGYRVLARIADGLGIPRELMNLGPAADGGAYAGGGPGTDPAEEVDEEVRRRVLLAAAGIAFTGQPVPGLGELVTLPGPSAVPPPSRILALHVVQVRDLTQRLVDASRAYGSDPQVSSAAAARATRLLESPGDEPVKRALMAAVAELHHHAGYAGFDAGLYDRAMYHYTRALELATQAGDVYLQAIALCYAGAATEDHGHPNDGLKMLQFAHVIAGRIPVGDQPKRIVGMSTRGAVRACAEADSATALARLGDPDGAEAALAKARELWQPTAADPSGDLDRVYVDLELERGRLDAAEPLAAASVRRWEGASNQRACTISRVVLATIHVRAGEPDGLELAHDAITGVMKLSSLRARQRLNPLATALEARPGTDARELARTARQVATTRA
jgi:transcriptional regulator with XRE-family HTH domain/tetratricopeptide (TPR) repeat protein